MRVITGSARGAKLKTLEGLATRPTSDRVKEAIFNIIQFDIEGRRVLDLFGGSGSTLMACEQTDRICRTMELDPKYASVIVERFYQEYPAQKIVVHRSGQSLEYADLRQAIA